MPRWRRERVLLLVTPAASRSSGSGPKVIPPAGEELWPPVSDMLACPELRFSSEELWHSCTRCSARNWSCWWVLAGVGIPRVARLGDTWLWLWLRLPLSWGGCDFTGVLCTVRRAGPATARCGIRAFEADTGDGIWPVKVTCPALEEVTSLCGIPLFGCWASSLKTRGAGVAMATANPFCGDRGVCERGCMCCCWGGDCNCGGGTGGKPVIWLGAGCWPKLGGKLPVGLEKRKLVSGLLVKDI